MFARGTRESRGGRVALMASASAWVGVLGFVITATGGRPHAAGVQATLKDGVYADAQAARGKALYQTHCVTCHMDNLLGTPPLAGDAFRAKWAALTVNDLYTKMKETMPSPEPGTLEPAEYIDIVAYVLKENKFPAGAQELKNDPDTLKKLSLGGG